MVSVRINGVEPNLRTDGVPKVTDLVELVKSAIDPDHMITEIEVNGEPISGEKWSQALFILQDATFDFYTDTPGQYLIAQVAKSPRAVQACFVQFRDARKTFQGGDTQGGNQRLKQATETLKAFFDWYGVLIQIASEEEKKALELEPNLTDILQTCKSICQLQLYKSWWALGELLQNELEPKLDGLEDKCRNIASQFGAGIMRRKVS
jgi:hypothetical protein